MSTYCYTVLQLVRQYLYYLASARGSYVYIIPSFHIHKIGKWVGP
jgi:hypothetical protein